GRGERKRARAAWLARAPRADVKNLRRPVAREEDVRRVDVAVNGAVSLDEMKRVGEPAKERDDLGDRERPLRAYPRGEAPARQVLHAVENDVPFLDDIQDGNNMGMDQPRGFASWSKERIERAFGTWPTNLQSDFAAHGDLLAAIHRTALATLDERLDPIAAHDAPNERIALCRHARKLSYSRIAGKLARRGESRTWRRCRREWPRSRSG